jgi:hypothetical protein
VGTVEGGALMITYKNCMEDIAKNFGVKIGENFIIENDGGRTVGIFKFDRNGLWKYEKENGYFYGWHDVLFWILIGLWGVRKITNEKVVEEALKNK